MGIKTRWVWLYAAITLLVMGCVGCVMAGVGDRPVPTAAPVRPVESRQITTPDHKPVSRPVEGL